MQKKLLIHLFHLHIEVLYDFRNLTDPKHLWPCVIKIFKPHLNFPDSLSIYKIPGWLTSQISWNTVAWFPQKKLIQIPGLSRTFLNFFQDFLHQSCRTFPGLSTKFQDFPGFLQSCMNSNNKISFLQNKSM